MHPMAKSSKVNPARQVPVADAARIARVPLRTVYGWITRGLIHNERTNKMRVPLARVLELADRSPS